jgi:tryptophan synthase alpha chain
LAVGFGISRPEQVAPLRGLADGVIVGSALVREVAKRTEEGASAEVVLKSVGEAAAAMLQACRAK